MGKHLLTAEIFDRQGRSLAWATNNYNQTHPIQAKFAKQAQQPDRIFLHAEIAALVKLRKGQKPYKIAIKRFRKDGTMALAAPCPVCVAAIKHWGISHVEYTL
jgi:tRNA(Arg) A34 adenosine deaminase TadA